MNEYQRTVRTANTFLLLCSDQDSPEVDQHLTRLQEMIGGQRIQPLHFTVQRFIFYKPEKFQAYLAELEDILSRCEPLTFWGSGLVSLYSEYRQARVLKWRIMSSEALQTLCTDVENALLKYNGRSFFPRGWHPQLISALEDISRADLSLWREEVRIPWPLFTANLARLVHFSDQDSPLTLGEVRLRGRPAAEHEKVFSGKAG